MLKKYLFTLWILAVCLGVWPCSARADPVQLRLKLETGDMFVYESKSHTKNPAARPTIHQLGEDEDGESIDIYREGHKRDVIVGQEENSFSVVSASVLQLKKSLVDGVHDVTAKAQATWGDALETVGCYSLNPDGNTEYLGAHSYVVTEIMIPGFFPIPLPEEAVDAGYEWSGTRSVRRSGASRVSAHVETFEEKRGYRCARLRFDFRVPERPPPNVSTSRIAKEIHVSATKTVWLAIEEGFVVQVHYSRARRPFLISPDKGEIVKDKETGEPVIDKTKTVTTEWDMWMAEHRKLSRGEIREARRGLYLLKTAQEFWAYRDQQEIAVRCIERFCSKFPHSPWFKVAFEQRDYMANWVNTVRRKRKKTEEGG